jgi:transcription elongation factor GreA
MPEQTVPLTPEGRERLLNELAGLREERKLVSERIQNARELGTSQTDAEYDDAKLDQGRIEGRILEIDDILRRAVIIDETQAHGSARIMIGSSVRVDQDGAERNFQIVSPPEADAAQGRISNDSPVGSALLGKKAGDTVEINVPRGVIKIKVLDIH